MPQVIEHSKKLCSNQILSPVKKRQYSTILRHWQTCHNSEKDSTILKQCQNLQKVRKRWYNTQTEQNCHQSEKNGTILKQSQNLLTVRKTWYNTQTEPKPVTSQKKKVQN